MKVSFFVSLSLISSNISSRANYRYIGGIIWSVLVYVTTKLTQHCQVSNIHNGENEDMRCQGIELVVLREAVAQDLGAQQTR